MPHDRSANAPPDPAILLRDLQLRVQSLYASSPASDWGVTLQQFAAALERSVRKRFAEYAATQQSLEGYLETLHLDDLALATACMQGSEAAWEYFVSTYRGYLRASAGAVTKNSRSGTDAQELADSLFAELYGLVDGKRGEASLFRYFHGRSSLKTWLRAILAQRHVDRLRQSRRWESLEREDGEEKIVPPQSIATPALDPYRSQYLKRFLFSLTACLEALEAGDRKRLELYYARGKTLAETGRLLGEHESSVSRNLERTRRELRAKVEEFLRAGGARGSQVRGFPPMTDAEIALCFQYAAEEAPIDFRQLFPEKPSGRSGAGRKESS
ncbi:MAG TPA: sigma-70 family RNA polymerase sigma factor [Candidatus Sulfotelmatobacter sp.]|nr:sigma-70 family RNA polymerase sigma factor [Candidatus Sulfotelmatobacter sp.]